jgi:hypothetical protein
MPVARLLKDAMKPEGSLPGSKDPFTHLYPQSEQSTPYHSIQYS